VARVNGVRVKQRVLGRTGLCVSEIGFGCGPTAGLIVSGERRAQRAAVQRALELGIDYFDTAPLYGAGESERALGSLLRELAATPRIATKVELGVEDLDNVRDTILKSVESSLKRLGQPRISVLHLHNRIGMVRAPQADLGSGALLGLDEVLGPGGVVETFAALRSQGIVDAFGCSAYGGDMAAVERVVDSGSFHCIQVHYSLLNTTAWTRPRAGAEGRDYRRIAARAARAGMGVVALRVLEAGLLAGRAPPAKAALAQEREAARARLAVLAPLLGPEPLVHTAVRFALSQPELTTVLVGFSDVAQVEDAVAAAAQGPLPAALLVRIEGGRT
jgi:aryl-alcohol dehydrogenase-like predicted oxidoreductase